MLLVFFFFFFFFFLGLFLLSLSFHSLFLPFFLTLFPLFLNKQTKKRSKRIEYDLDEVDEQWLQARRERQLEEASASGRGVKRAAAPVSASAKRAVVELPPPPPPPPPSKNSSKKKGTKGRGASAPPPPQQQQPEQVPAHPLGILPGEADPDAPPLGAAVLTEASLESLIDAFEKGLHAAVTTPLTAAAIYRKVRLSAMEFMIQPRPHSTPPTSTTGLGPKRSTR